MSKNAKRLIKKPYRYSRFNPQTEREYPIKKYTLFIHDDPDYWDWVEYQYGIKWELYAQTTYSYFLRDGDELCLEFDGNTPMVYRGKSESSLRGNIPHNEAVGASLNLVKVFKKLMRHLPLEVQKRVYTKVEDIDGLGEYRKNFYLSLGFEPLDDDTLIYRGEDDG